MSRPRPGTAVFFVLLAATLIVAVLVVRARTPDLVLEETGGLRTGLPTVFDPTSPGGRQSVRLQFFVRESDPAGRVEIVDSEEDVVRTLESAIALEAEEEVVLRWDGRDDAGRVVPEGRYRLAVELPGADREMIWPQRITIGPEPVATEEPS